MAEKKKIVRLADVGELENILKKDLAEEEAKGKDSDTLFCEDVAGELTDLESLPTIDPETLRPVARLIHGTVPETEDGIFCSRCGGFIGMETSYIAEHAAFCWQCGAKMEDATNEQTEIS